MKGFGHIDKVYYLAGAHTGVQRTYSTQSHYRTPVGIFVERAGYLGLSLHREHLVRLSVHRILQTEAVVEACEVEGGQQACRRDEWAVECICLSIKKIYIVVEPSYAFQEIHFFCLSVFSEQAAAFFHTQHFLAERKVCCDDFSHPFFNLCNLFVCQEYAARSAVFCRLFLTDVAVEPARKGIIYRKYLSRKHFPHYILQHEAQRADVCASSVRMVISDEAHIVWVYDLVVEGLEFVVDEHCQNR